jgi:hypothetical protein
MSCESAARLNPHAGVAMRCMTPDEVYATLCALKRRYGSALAVIPGTALSPETPLAEWVEAWDLEAPQLTVQHFFGLDERDAEWKSLDWSGGTLRDLCEFVAARAEVPVIESLTVLGATDRKAGAFVVLKRLLASRGVDVTGIAPSTRLETYEHNGFHRIAPELQRLVPHVAEFDGPAGLMFLLMLIMAGGVLGALICLTAALVDGAACLVPGVVSVAGVFAAGTLAKRLSRTGPTAARFPGLRTFRDLSAAIVGEWVFADALRCERCSYSLIGLTDRRCPECGTPFRAAEFGMNEAALSRALTHAATSGTVLR